MNSTPEAVAGNVTDDGYEAFLARVRTRFVFNAPTTRPVFATDAANLFDLYLQSFPAGIERQHHTCSACRHFINHFGGLVTIDDAGRTASAIWNPEDADPIYRAALERMAAAATSAKVTGPFLSSEPTWGHPVTGMWRHLHVEPDGRIFQPTLLTAGQTMAEKREDFKNVIRALEEFTLPVLEQAMTLLETEVLYRSEKVMGPAKWLRDLHIARNSAPVRNCANVVWLAIATAPAGFAHPRSSMIGTLLEDIAAGKDFAEVSRAFKAKMHPLQYQRPQAAPAAGNIAQAEKVIAQMGLAPALERRIARLDEVPKLWEPRQQQPAASPAGGVFGHLQPKGAAPLAPMAGVPPVLMTLEKFVRTVVPTAEAMELYVNGGREAFIAITTAVNADAPPILQWDREDNRNPFAWYVWQSGSPPSQYGLTPGWIKVAAITRLPARWNDATAAHQGDGVIVLLEGARETRHAGNALFPECLRSELHSIRSTIEAYAKGAQMQGLAEGSAIGYDLRDKSGGYPALVRVQAGGRTADYKLDRWD